MRPWQTKECIQITSVLLFAQRQRSVILRLKNWVQYTSWATVWGEQYKSFWGFLWRNRTITTAKYYWLHHTIYVLNWWGYLATLHNGKKHEIWLEAPRPPDFIEAYWAHVLLETPLYVPRAFHDIHRSFITTSIWGHRGRPDCLIPIESAITLGPIWL